jgi:hypothetical protein
VTGKNDMVPSDQTRASLAQRQAALVNALVTASEAPPGFDSRRVLAAAESLARKRARSSARAWPSLALALGPEFDERFAAYASATPMPAKGGPLADGYGFARWLSARGWLPEAGRLEAMGVELRYRRVRAGLLRRRWPALRVMWSRPSRRLTLAFRFPSIGERWFSF